jgi:acetolactate synthase-1/3 small subunit
MIRRRGFNIYSISVGSTEKKDLARVTMTVNGDKRLVEQVVKQLNKLIEVIKVSLLNPERTVARELALIKVNAPEKTRSDIINYAKIFKGHIVDVSRKSLIVEVTGDSDKIDAFIELLRPYGIREVARTGITALLKGSESVTIK